MRKNLSEHDRIMVNHAKDRGKVMYHDGFEEHAVTLVAWLAGHQARIEFANGRKRTVHQDTVRLP